MKISKINMAKLNNPDYSRAKTIHDFTVRSLTGEPELIKLDKYKGFVCVIVNIAINSPLTGTNYKLLNELMDKYGESKGSCALRGYDYDQ